ncbi:enoyl-CoA hydratase/isomerase family protein [Thermodesulfobacteriota bacterium]
MFTVSCINRTLTVTRAGVIESDTIGPVSIIIGFYAASERSPMSYETIIFEKSEGVAKITLNRLDNLNALNDAMQEDLMSVFEDIAKADDIRVLVIAGAGRAFSAGADIRQRFLDPIEKSKTGEVNMALVDTFTRVGVAAIRRIEQPIIASINGAAVGFGCTLSLTCDLRIASDKARFGLGFVRMGVTPEFGSTYYLPRIVGPAKSLELLFTGKIIDAAEAKEIGLVNQVVPADELENVTMELAKNIAKAPPMSIRMIKKGVYQGMENDADTQVLWEHLVFTRARQTEDHEEGVRSFLEKREPEFKGK